MGCLFRGTRSWTLLFFWCGVGVGPLAVVVVSTSVIVAVVIRTILVRVMVARSSAAVRTTGGRVILGLSRRARKRRGGREERVSAGMRVASRGLSEGRRRGGRRRHSLLPCELVPLYGILSCLVCSLIVVASRVLFCPPDLIAKARKKERKGARFPFSGGTKFRYGHFLEFFRFFSPLKPSYPPCRDVRSWRERTPDRQRHRPRGQRARAP